MGSEKEHSSPFSLLLLCLFLCFTLGSRLLADYDDIDAAIDRHCGLGKIDFLNGLDQRLREPSTLVGALRTVQLALRSADSPRDQAAAARALSQAVQAGAKVDFPFLAVVEHEAERVNRKSQAVADQESKLAPVISAMQGLLQKLYQPRGVGPPVRRISTEECLRAAGLSPGAGLRDLNQSLVARGFEPLTSLPSIVPEGLWPPKKISKNVYDRLMLERAGGSEEYPEFRNYNDAMRTALAWLESRGFNGSLDHGWELGKLTQKHSDSLFPNSFQTRGPHGELIKIRIEIHPIRALGDVSRPHINVSFGKEDGPHFLFPGTRADLDAVLRQLSPVLREKAKQVRALPG